MGKEEAAGTRAVQERDLGIRGGEGDIPSFHLGQWVDVRIYGGLKSAHVQGQLGPVIIVTTRAPVRGILVYKVTAVRVRVE